MSSINFNDYSTYTNYDSGYDVSSLLGGTSNTSGKWIRKSKKFGIALLTQDRN